MVSLRTLPTETRQHIFELCFAQHLASEPYHEDTSYEASALLIALRGEKDLYDEALYIFYKINTVYYRIIIETRTQNNPIKSLDAFKHVRNLGLDLTIKPNLFLLQPAAEMLPNFGGQVTNQLETLTINIRGDNEGTDVARVACPFFLMLSQHFSELKRFNLNVVSKKDNRDLGILSSLVRRVGGGLQKQLRKIGNAPTEWEHQKNARTVYVLILEANQLFGSEATRVSGTLPNLDVFDQWVWTRDERNWAEARISDQVAASMVAFAKQLM